MIFSILILALLAAIAYFTYVQGLFSATISAVCAAIAAVLAFGYAESLALAIGGGKYAAQAPAMVQCGLFALIYVVLRVIADNGISGNVRYPVLLDKIGAGVMGVIAGIFATGTVATAAQTLPFGPSFMMFSRYAVEDRSTVEENPRGRNVDVEIYNQLRSSEFTPEDRQGLWVPVDAMLVQLVERLSEGGSLAGPRELSQDYPDWFQAVFAQRLGRQSGASDVALNAAGREDVRVAGVYRLPEERYPQIDAEKRNRVVPEELSVAGDQAIVVIRTVISPDAADDGWVFFGPANARLVVGDEQYFPVGTLESGRIIFNHKPDDYLMARTVEGSEGGVDFVYVVPQGEMFTGETVADDVFFEFKRFGRVDLGNEPVVTAAPPASGRFNIPRKKLAAAAFEERFGTSLETVRSAVPDQAPVTPAPDQQAPAQEEEEAAADRPRRPGAADIIGLPDERTLPE